MSEKNQELSDLDLEKIAAAAGADIKGISCQVACVACDVCRTQNLPPTAVVRGGKRVR